MKRARAWLNERGLRYVFHDYKAAGIDRARLERWCDEVGWETLLNRSGTTFRKLPETQKAGLDRRRAIELMLAQPSMIKRPVLEIGKRLAVGFTPETYESTAELRPSAASGRLRCVRPHAAAPTRSRPS